MKEKLPPEEKEQETTSDISSQTAAIVCAMTSMRGYATFALLGSIYEAARTSHGFVGTLEFALAVLEQLPGVRVEQNVPLDQSLVFSDCWKPT